MEGVSILEFALILNGESSPEFREIVSICIPREFITNPTCVHKILPLYFHLTRSSNQTTIAELKKTFSCGAELIYRIKSAVAERKPICLPKRGKANVRNDAGLKTLVDRLTTENGHLSDTELASMLGTSRSTINRVRHDLLFKYKQLRHGQVLSERQVDARLSFCRDNVDREWSLVMFSDESRVSTSPDSPVMWWVKRGQHIYIESEKFPPSIMVWAGIIGTMKTPLIKCPQRLNTEGYAAMLEANGIFAFLHWCGDTSLFQQDGAPCHTAVSTMRRLRDNGIAVLPNWPANSPDLSPVEQIWAIMKRYILQRFGMRTPLSLAQLEEAVFDAYNRIGWRTVAILTMSAKYCIRACIERNGRFVGDLVGECCRRARVELETESDMLLLSVPITPTEGTSPQHSERNEMSMSEHRDHEQQQGSCSYNRDDQAHSLC